MSIEHAMGNHIQLDGMSHIIDCNWAWLSNKVVSEVAGILEESMVGTPVVAMLD
jgi:hypothetical protein